MFGAAERRLRYRIVTSLNGRQGHAKSGKCTSPLISLRIASADSHILACLPFMHCLQARSEFCVVRVRIA